MQKQKVSTPNIRVRDKQQQVLDWLLAQGCLKQGDLDRVETLQKDQPQHSATELLMRLGVLSEKDMARAWATAFHAPLLLAAQVPVPTYKLESVSPRFLKLHRLIPLACDAQQLHLWVSDPSDTFAIAALAYAAGRPTRVSVGLPGDIERLIESLHGEGRSPMDTLSDHLARPDASTEDIEHLKDLASEAPVIRLVNLLIQRAVELRASDIHIEPFETQLKVRYRVDGVLQDTEAPPVGSSAAVISRIKIMARLDIAERRLPQDGRITLRVQGKELDLRVSTIPTSFGESLVMRLLDRQTVAFDFPSLGFDGQRLEDFLALLDRTHGMLLVTGPTGSGKTTTLYAALARLNTAARKIITVEDPVEYQLEGINQIQARPAIGLDFANALRSIVRQDPDVIMIGEMRDIETSQIAIQSSLTGHLVLSTLHTNNAAASITRLLDMGVEPYLIASTVNGILAQRLVRRLVPEYCETYEPTAETVEKYQLDRHSDARPIRLLRPQAGVADSRAYRGRSALTELLIVDERLRGLIMRRATASTLEQAAREGGMRTLNEEGLRQALMGITSLEEVLRVTSHDC